MLRRLVLMAVAALAVALTLTSSSLAARRHQGHAADLAYVNPFTSPDWVASRTDMGVDWDAWSHATPVIAIGDAVILGSENHAGWPGGHLIWYQLTDGSHTGDVIYVAEHLKNLLPAGTHVSAGDTIATALAGYPGTEWGWADRYGTPRAAPCYHEGMATNSGKEMARLMESLGAQTMFAPGSGVDQPSGKLC